MNKKGNVVERLRAMISSGELQPGQKLQSGVDLANSFGVAHLTMRRALRELELSGDIQIIHGRGIFVSDKNHVKHKLLIVRPSLADNMIPANYILPYFLQRCGELGVEVDEADLLFLRHSPISNTVRLLKDNQYTGILLACGCFNGTEPELQLFRRLKIPVIIPRGTQTDAGITGFGVLRSAERQAWKDGLMYLKECGIRKAGLLLAKRCDDSTTYRSYTQDEHLELLRTCGFDTNGQLIKFVDISNVTQLCEDVEKALSSLMDQPEPPDAVYCFSDFIALYTYLAAGKMNLRIPEDLSVMGYCGYPGGKMLSPPLATVDCDYPAAGIRAAEMLCDPEKWYYEDGIKDFIIPHKIKKRASVAVKKEVTP